jgi:4-hydroxy-tetrahydrodipicolinate reductase
MKIILIGYGHMGHEIEQVALEKGHEIILKVDKENRNDLNVSAAAKADVAIEFTGPDSAADLIINALSLGIPVASGSTGWHDRFEEVTSFCKAHNGAFLHASNFSVGVNVLFHLNAEMARIMGKLADYKVTIEEIHHIRKIDAPSGTAVKLAEEIIRQHSGYESWKPFKGETRIPEKNIPVQSVREGAVPGIHSVSWESEIDSITLRHEAKSRKGFAIGALLAAEFLIGKKGVFSMSDVLKF